MLLRKQFESSGLRREGVLGVGHDEFAMGCLAQ